MRGVVSCEHVAIHVRLLSAVTEGKIAVHADIPLGKQEIRLTCPAMVDVALPVPMLACVVDGCPGCSLVFVCCFSVGRRRGLKRGGLQVVL